MGTIATLVEHTPCTLSDQVRIHSMLVHIVVNLTTLLLVFNEANGCGGSESSLGNDLRILGSYNVIGGGPCGGFISSGSNNSSTSVHSNGSGKQILRGNHHSRDIHHQDRFHKREKDRNFCRDGIFRFSRDMKTTTWTLSETETEILLKICHFCRCQVLRVYIRFSTTAFLVLINSHNMPCR